jgi:hypothetical protein
VTQLGKTIGFGESKLLVQDGTLLATATASERLLEAAKALRPKRAKRCKNVTCFESLMDI